MQIVLTLRTYLVSDLQNPLVKIPIWQDTHIYETQISGETVLHKVYEVYVVYKQGPTGIEPRYCRKRMNLYMRYLLCQYSYLKLLGLILIMLMVIMFQMLIIAVVIQGIQ